MQLLGFLPVCCLDVIRACVNINAQHIIVVCCRSTQAGCRLHA
jgi:hypothetical protein